MTRRQHDYILHAGVYKQGDYDCTNKGASSKSDKVKLVWMDDFSSPVHQEDHEDDPERYVILESYLSKDHAPRVVPVKLFLEGKRPQFGGNFCYTSDSRFPWESPLKIFDRIE